MKSQDELKNFSGASQQNTSNVYTDNILYSDIQSFQVKVSGQLFIYIYITAYLHQDCGSA